MDYSGFYNKLKSKHLKFRSENFLERYNDFLELSKKYKSQLEPIVKFVKFREDFFDSMMMLNCWNDFLNYDIEKWFLNYIDFCKKEDLFSETAANNNFYEKTSEVYYDESISPTDNFNGIKKHPLKSETYWYKKQKHRDDGPAHIEYDINGKVTKGEYWFYGKRYEILKWMILVGSEE